FAETFQWQQTQGTGVQLAPQTVNESKVAFVAPSRGSSLSFALRVSSLGNASAPLAGAVLSRSVPDAPGSIQAVPGAGSATVQWTAPPFDGLSAVTGYTVTATPGGTTLSTAASSTSAVIGSLQRGITYTFAVAAVNAVGTGPAAT